MTPSEKLATEIYDKAMTRIGALTEAATAMLAWIGRYAEVPADVDDPAYLDLDGLRAVLVPSVPASEQRPPAASSALAPCPFCGGEAINRASEALHIGVECPACEIVGPRESIHAHDDGSVAAWNRRAPVSSTRTAALSLRFNFGPILASMRELEREVAAVVAKDEELGDGKRELKS